MENSLFDLLSTDMYVSYNIKLAQILDLQSAIYISELININRKAIEKNKLKEGGFFKIDRNYIEERTTLKREDQKSIDANLKSIKLISIGESSDLLKVDMDILTSLLLGKKEIVTEVVQPVKRGRPSKQEIVIRALKANVETTNVELRQAYEDWIDAVCAKQGWMTKTHVIEGEKSINKYNKEKDLDIALEILRIATLGGYRDMEWAIRDYEKKLKNSSTTNNASTRVGEIPPPPTMTFPVQKPKAMVNKDEVF